MTRRDDGRTSLVDFLRSLKFSHSDQARGAGHSPNRFARLKQRVQTNAGSNSEELHLVRSAN